MSSTDAALVLAACVQAVSAGAIAIFTVKLVRRTKDLADFTRDYTNEMRRANELQAEANRLAHAALALASGQASPLLVITRDGRNSDGLTFVEGVLTVENHGGGLAREIVVETDWGQAPLDRDVLQPGSRAQAKVKIPHEQWTRGSDPRATSVGYRDSQGEIHEQNLQS